MTPTRCGWPHETSARPHCDGENDYIDTWSGRIVHQITTGHKPVPADSKPDPDVQPRAYASVSEYLR